MLLNNFHSQRNSAMIKQQLRLFVINYLFVARNFNFKYRNFVFSMLAQAQFSGSDVLE